MGRNESELAQIAASGPFDAPTLRALRSSIDAVARRLKDIAGSEGWEGLAASAASTYFEVLSRQYFEIEAAISRLEHEIDQANGVRAHALELFRQLPSAQAPSWVHNTLEAFDFPGIPDPVDLAQGGLSIIENFLGSQREAAAGRILESYRAALDPHAMRIQGLRNEFEIITNEIGRDDFGVPDTDDDSSTGSWNGGGAYRGPGYTGVEFRPPVVRPPSHPPHDDDVWVGVDDPHTGVLPAPPGGGGPTVPTGPGVGGGVPGVVGAGAGTAIAGAGALAASRFAGGAAGGLARGGAAIGGAVRGGGGLLGAAGPGMSAQGANAARAAAPGGRAGSGLLGSSGVNGAQGRDDRKRKTGRGLGGPIAPKLDDDDETVLPGSGARAGGRDEHADSGLDD